MSAQIVEVLKRLNQSLSRLDAAWAARDDAQARASQLAAVVLDLAETGVAALCRLRHGATPVLSVSVKDGASRQDWADCLTHQLDWSALTGWQVVPAPAALGQAGLSVAIMSDPAQDVMLGVILPRPRARTTLAVLAQLLTAAVERVQFHLCAGGVKLLEEEVKKGDVAESAAVFHHELGNILNNLVLDAAALERELNGSGGARIQEIKNSVSCFADRMQQFIQYRHSCRTVAYPVDLHSIVQARADELRASGQPVRLELAADVPPIQATASDVSRLVRLLLQNASAHAQDDGELVVRTSAADKAVLLTVTVPGPALSGDDWRRAFEPFTHTGETLNGLELAVCRAVLRRFQGKLRGESPGPGVTVFTCEFATELG